MKKSLLSILSFVLFTLLSNTITAQQMNKTDNPESETEFSIEYEKFTLDNGLEVILHEDHSDPIVAVASLIHVGSSREKPGKTGFAHFFEHMSFNDSENVPVGANRKMIPEWGGTRNGGTSNDYTVYYEVVPKDAFEKILWIDSDRFGYMINTVTKSALEREKQVVKNEKRENYDNRPYGYTTEVISKNLYPEGHPYSWSVIGALPDLQAATIDDVKEFYEKYYGAGNASLVIAGDIDAEETKELVKKWFGEIRKGPEVEKMKPMPVTLTESKSLYYEDNFAKLPELRITFPTVEDYNEDTYALQILGRLLSGSKKSPLYKGIVEEQKLAPDVRTYQRSNELAGEFVFTVRANEGVDLDRVKSEIDADLKQFEAEGVNLADLKRIKAEQETDLYQGASNILSKAFQLVQDNEFAGDPGFITERAKLLNAVTSEDVMRVYNKYIKDKNYVMTSFVPKGQTELAVEGSKLAEVWIEEVVQDVAGEEVSQGEEAQYDKTPSKFDRSEPEFGELPLFKAPEVWTGALSNGMKVYGIQNNEVPLVQFDLTIPGGHLLDPPNKAGVANLLTDLMMEGTANKTPAELEDAIGMLGASINIYTSNEDIHIVGNCLTKNFSETMDLVSEILLQPRWDQKELDRLKIALETNLKGREANPSAIASMIFDQLVYGETHPFAVPTSGTLKSTTNITMQDLKDYYNKLGAENASFHIAGAINKENALDQIEKLNELKSESADLPEYKDPNENVAGNLYFIDVPGAKQSVIYAGSLALSKTDPDSNKLDYANEIIGGGSSGKLFQTLRIEKGYTYGAYSSIQNSKIIAPYIVRTSVRANATLKSLEIIEEMLKNYSNDFTETEVGLTTNKVLKANTRAYESLGAKLEMLKTISKYDKPLDFAERDQKVLIDMSLEDYRNIINTYINEDNMVYVVVGDKETQYEEVKKLGKNVIELDAYGNPVNTQ